VAAAGGRDNAFTSRDYTAYFQQVPKQKLPEMMQLEADRMRHLTLDANEFAQEIRVVMEERRLRTEDQAARRCFSSKLTAVAFQAHPYRVPVIGWMNDLREHDRRATPAPGTTTGTRQTMPMSWWSVTWSIEAVFQLAEQHYGSLAARPLPVRKPQDEPPQAGIRRLTVKAPADLPVVTMAYKVPVIRDVDRDVDPYALEMLSAVLSGHEAARFSKNLVRQQRLAVEATASYRSTARGPGVFYLHASPSEGRTRAELEAGLRAEVADVQQKGVAADELTRAKAQLIAGQIYKLDSMFAQAMEIGQLEAVGIPCTQHPRIIEKLQAVTAEQVQAVARKYFRDEQLTVAELDPQPLPAAPRARSPFAPRH
jgi:zinc protease